MEGVSARPALLATGENGSVAPALRLTPLSHLTRHRIKNGLEHEHERRQ